VTSFRDAPNGGENWTTLPGHFKEHGYFTASAGKVFHPNLPINFDYPRSWSVQPTLAEKDPCFDVQRGENVSNSTMSCSFAPGDGHLDADSTCADQVLANLDAWEANFSDGTPFFLAAGFQSPRLPWSYPQSVADRYPAADKIPIVNPALRQSPTDASLALEWFRPTEIDWFATPRRKCLRVPRHRPHTRGVPIHATHLLAAHRVPDLDLPRVRPDAKVPTVLRPGDGGD
jgi:hypothetical protein